jgi:hypothetical protein
MNAMSPEDVAEILGRPAPTLMYRFNEASGATELISGSANLTDSGTPTKQAIDPILGNNLVTEFESNDDSMVAAASSTGEVTAGETLSVMWVGRLKFSHTGSANIASKTSTAFPWPGWTLYSHDNGGGGPSGSISFIVGTDTTLQSMNVLADHGLKPQTILGTRSVTSNLRGLWTREGSVTSIISTLTGSMENTEVLSVGKSTLITSPSFMVTGVLMIWIGSNGDNMGESDRLAIAKALKFE